ncbi:hypothetical protein GGS23DRAFT_584585 [Durotheca rogersii]|uniref:uncharacterized protein n=1 Tax=Durotheca rogersii TaxID=419775 RepID=UPI00221E9E35|nr:uncharacterized protein GGS23DRAFT_584585 [Durotheca rogersii]KAI5859660.1 hypothetical protein GGS23DRAFT_584585 [Durotheca rogersii]
MRLLDPVLYVGRYIYIDPDEPILGWRVGQPPRRYLAHGECSEEARQPGTPVSQTHAVERESASPGYAQGTPTWWARPFQTRGIRAYMAGEGAVAALSRPGRVDGPILVDTTPMPRLVTMTREVVDGTVDNPSRAHMTDWSRERGTRVTLVLVVEHPAPRRKIGTVSLEARVSVTRGRSRRRPPSLTIPFRSCIIAISRIRCVRGS